MTRVKESEVSLRALRNKDKEEFKELYEKGEENLSYAEQQRFYKMLGLAKQEIFSIKKRTDEPLIEEMQFKVDRQTGIYKSKERQNLKIGDQSQFCEYTDFLHRSPISTRMRKTYEVIVTASASKSKWPIIDVIVEITETGFGVKTIKVKSSINKDSLDVWDYRGEGDITLFSRNVENPHWYTYDDCYELALLELFEESVKTKKPWMRRLIQSVIMEMDRSHFLHEKKSTSKEKGVSYEDTQMLMLWCCFSNDTEQDLRVKQVLEIAEKDPKIIQQTIKKVFTNYR